MGRSYGIVVEDRDCNNDDGINAKRYDDYTTVDVMRATEPLRSVLCAPPHTCMKSPCASGNVGSTCMFQGGDTVLVGRGHALKQPAPAIFVTPLLPGHRFRAASLGETTTPAVPNQRRAQACPNPQRRATPWRQLPSLALCNRTANSTNASDHCVARAFCPETVKGIPLGWISEATRKAPPDLCNRTANSTNASDHCVARAFCPEMVKGIPLGCVSEATRKAPQARRNKCATSQFVCVPIINPTMAHTICLMLISSAFQARRQPRSVHPSSGGMKYEVGVRWGQGWAMVKS
eukprot:gene10076-biopygen1333